MDNTNCLKDVTDNQIKELEFLQGKSLIKKSGNNIPEASEKNYFHDFYKSWCSSYYQEKYNICVQRLRSSNRAL